MNLTEKHYQGKMQRFLKVWMKFQKQAYTMGIKEHYGSKERNSSCSNRKFYEQMLCTNLYQMRSHQMPASILQLHQVLVTVVADEDALSLIKEKGLL